MLSGSFLKVSLKNDRPESRTFFSATRDNKKRRKSYIKIHGGTNMTNNDEGISDKNQTWSVILTDEGM